MKCRWCLKERKSMSDWEQESLKNGWLRLCKPCARKRLDNPANALLPMRRINPDHPVRLRKMMELVEKWDREKIDLPGENE